MFRRTLLALALLLAAFPATAWAQTAADSVSIDASVRGGTLGFGPEAEVRMGSFGLRLGVNAFDLGLNNVFHETFRSAGAGYSYDTNVHFGGNLHLLNGGLTGDWYPFGSGFRLSAGGYLDGNRISMHASPTGMLQIGNTMYAQGQIGQVDGQATVNTFAPYFGVGYSRLVYGRLRLSVDAGILYEGTPDISLSASGPITTVAQFQSDLARQRSRIMQDVNFPVYPVLEFGIGYQF